MSIEPVMGRDAQEMAKHLRELVNDDLRWITVFIDDKTGQLWRMSFPHSEMHGGGPPLLEPVTREEVLQEFLVDPSDLDLA
ncbi:MAG: Imm27 family immunity protein [Acidimicrobiales bacterium]|nr:Imm27 family immunity protein [Acidimicrobiales bacterium]MDZ7826260.1 Imm27 family immunity protein [Gammaproteobacteria bacterium]